MTRELEEGVDVAINAHDRPDLVLTPEQLRKLRNAEAIIRKGLIDYGPS